MDHETISGHSDAQIAALSLTDAQYFTYIVARYEAKFRRYISRLGVAAEYIDDVLQNIFIKIYINLADFNSSLSFSSWAYRIAHNETISFYRHRKARPEGNAIPVPEEIIENIANDVDVVAHVEHGLRAEVLQTTLSHLSADARNIIVLRYFEEKSYEEISDILRVPLGTVATKIFRAKRELKSLLEKKGYQHE